MHSKFLISTHDIFSYNLPKLLQNNFARDEILRRGDSRWVFLQHGVTYNDVFPALSYESTGYDFFVVSSPREDQFVTSRGGLRNTTLQTGFPRFDRAAKASFNANRYVLFMPTWRLNLGTPSYISNNDEQLSLETINARIAFTESMQSFLAHPDLIKILQKINIEVRVIAHYELEKNAIFRGMDLPRNVKLVNSEETDIGDELRNASALITDWSSVAFDAAYFGKPVIYFQFDQEAFRESHYKQGYFDFETDGFGQVSVTAEDTVNALKDIINSDFTVQEPYASRVLEFFPDRRSTHTEELISKLDSISRE